MTAAFSSGHANSVKDMLSRLETMVLMAADLPLAAIRSQIASAVDIMVHVSRMRDRRESNGDRGGGQICKTARSSSIPVYLP